MIRIHPTAIIHPNVTIEDNVLIGPYCVIGGAPEDKKFFDKKPEFAVVIKKGARLSEFVTVHHGTIRDTVIGKNTVIFQKSHVAHDVVLEDNVIIGGLVSLAGHTHVMDGANISGHSATVPYTVIGAYGFLGASSLLTKHLTVGDKWVGYPARYSDLNTIGLQRASLSYEDCLDKYEARWCALCDARKI